MISRCRLRERAVLLVAGPGIEVLGEQFLAHQLAGAVETQALLHHQLVFLFRRAGEGSSSTSRSLRCGSAFFAACQSPVRTKVISLEPFPSPFSHSRAEGRMRAALPLMLFLTLTMSAPPVAAQALRWQNAPDPIHQTIKREAARFAADKPDVAGSVGEPAPSDWSRVRKLATRTRLIVTIKGEPPRRWTFEEADDFQITVHDPGGVQRMIARSEVAEIQAFATRGSLA